tara:strand:+ start:311 stop:454 length:144 start_codon:yes stop_codon:yes gene_type:complete
MVIEELIKKEYDGIVGTIHEEVSALEEKAHYFQQKYNEERLKNRYAK